MSAKLTREGLKTRIQSYLGNGGLFNPEMMEHEKVRDLILDCREIITALEQELAATKVGVRMTEALIKRVDELEQLVSVKEAILVDDLEQINRLQQQLSAEQKKREEAERIWHQNERANAEIDQHRCVLMKENEQLQHRLDQAEVKNAELREAVTRLSDKISLLFSNAREIKSTHGQVIGVESHRAEFTGFFMGEVTDLFNKALSSTPDVGQWVRKEDLKPTFAALEAGLKLAENCSLNPTAYENEIKREILRLKSLITPQKEKEK